MEAKIKLRIAEGWIPLIFFLFCVALNVAADEIKLIPSFAVKQEYNDNILYTTSEVQRDFSTTFSPGLSFLQKTERLETNLSGRVDRRLYSKYSEFDATDQFYDGTARYAFTERLAVSALASYSKDSRPDRDVETTGLAFTGVTRYRQKYGISSEYSLSEIFLTTFSYDYLNDTYSDSRYTDMESHAFNLGFVHDLSYFMQKTQARMNLGYTRYNVTDLRVDNYEWTAGINRALNEKWNLLADAGLRYTRSRFNYSEYVFSFPYPYTVYHHDSNEDWGGVGQLALTYKGLTNSGYVRMNHDIMPASGRSGTTERTSFLVNLIMKLTYEFQGIINGGYFINKSRAGQYSIHEIDENSIWINPSIVYNFTQDSSIDFSYTYNKIHYNVTNTDAERNLFQVTCRFRYVLFE